MASVLGAVALLAGFAVPASLVAQAPPAGATGKCKDGTYTTSAEKKGACAGHKGVAKWLAAAPAAPAAAPDTKAMKAPSSKKPAAATSPAPAPAPAPAATKTAALAGAPAGATALCKDGTYSKSKHRSGACSKHGGVKEWLAPAQ